jgi:hypothetical protein
MPSKRVAETLNGSQKRSRGSTHSTAKQSVAPAESQQQLFQRQSPRKALALAASQATENCLFESQLRDLVPEEAVAAPVEGSNAATEANTDADNSADIGGFDARFANNFEGIGWSRLPGFITPLRTQKQKKGWIYRHGYRVALASDPKRIWFICKYCHQHKIIDTGGESKYEVTQLQAITYRNRLKAMGCQRMVSLRKFITKGSKDT